jgi:hypothetical protein
MTVRIVVPIDDASFEQMRAAAAARGMTVETYVASLVRQWLPPRSPSAQGHVSSIFGIVQEGEPTDIARDKDKMIGDAAWREHLDETKQE